MSERLIKISVAAEMFGVSVRTLRRRAEKGTLNVVRSETGRMFVKQSDLPGEQSVTNERRVALYARESSTQNKAAMKSQVDMLRQYAAARGWQVTQEVTEVASGMNDNRPKLHRLLNQSDTFDLLLVENKDRLTRFGFRWFEALAGFDIHVINTRADQTEDLMEDLVSIITSFAARLYGQRRGRTRSKAAITALQDNENET